MAGRGGGDRTRQTPEFPAIYDGQATIDICHVALTKQLTLFEGQLPPTAASTIRHAPAHQHHPRLGTRGTNLQPPFKLQDFVRETAPPEIARQNGLLPICPLDP